MYTGYTTVKITCTCPFCGDTKELEVFKKDLVAWDNGVLIQRAFSYLDANDRERLKTGICPKCWDEMCGLAGY